MNPIEAWAEIIEMLKSEESLKSLLNDSEAQQGVLGCLFRFEFDHPFMDELKAKNITPGSHEAQEVFYMRAKKYLALGFNGWPEMLIKNPGQKTRKDHIQ